MLRNKKVIVAGGGSGIGKAVARKLLDAGAELVLASRNLEKLQGALREIDPDGRAAIQTATVDVTDDDSVARFFRQVGPFDHIVSTVKPRHPTALFADSAIADAATAFDVKFWGQYRLARQCLPHIRPGGSIVLTSGVASLRSSPGFSMVGAINAATEALVRGIAIELAPLRVNAVCPGMVASDPPAPERDQRLLAIASALPLGRLAMPAEVADAYLYLLCNTYATGTVTVIDGGAVC
jgi:NAD(P)-dependent dehydrogenase (short-subunit alcohol dehydrogenase family)